MRIPVALILASGLPLVLACSIGDDDDDKKLTEEKFCQEYAKRECAVVAPLCTYAEASCQPSRTAECRARATAWKTGTSMRAFRPERAEGCLEKVKEIYGHRLITGSDLRELDQICAKVFQGTVKALGDCLVDADCEGDLICDPTKFRCGRKKAVASGDGCANFGEICPVGEFCKSTAGSHLCTRRQGPGATCDLAQPCLENLQCKGTCVDKTATGLPCGNSDECQSGYCSPYSSLCGGGLSFAEGSASCKAFMGEMVAPDANTRSPGDAGP